MKLSNGVLNGIRFVHQGWKGGLRVMGDAGHRFWHLLMRNRLAIAIASVFWLIFRSGAQPRRLAYPCQQVAAVNVGAFLAGLVPALFLSKSVKCPKAIARGIRMRRQFLAAGCLLLAAFFAVEGFQYAKSLDEPEWPVQVGYAGNPPQAVVGIARRDWTVSGTMTSEEIERLVLEAIERAGGLESLMVDKPSVDGVNPADGVINVVIKPNLVQTGWDGSIGVVTDPRVCAAIAKAAYLAGADQVTIAEGCAVGAGADSTETAFADAGYDTNWDMVFDTVIPGYPAIPLVDLNDSGGKDQTIGCRQVLLGGNAVLRDDSNPTAFGGYWVQEILLDADCLISAPTFKNHYNGTVTLALKNVGVGINPNDIYHNYPEHGWGTDREGKMSINHDCDYFPCLVAPTPGSENEIVHRSLVDVNLARPVDFAVVDGRIGVTNGPVGYPNTAPNPHMQMFMASADSVALDAVGALCMGYWPDAIPQLNLAEGTGALGTKDRGVISVVGDRLWKVRSYDNDFPEGYGSPYGDAVRADTQHPLLLGLSPDVVEGQQLAEAQTVTAAGISDTSSESGQGGVVRAELAALRLGPNLVQNGGFETGDLTGWQPWESPWGTPVRNVVPSSTKPGAEGDYVLKLGDDLCSSSFGIYQEIAVEPGKTYRLNCQWAGTKLSNQNWWEVILIDGIYTYQQADEAAYVEKNYMYAYDDVTFGLPGGQGTQFGWNWTHEHNVNRRNEVDWNNRHGLRTATGNVMTVVLKVGNWDEPTPTTGVEGFFDSVTLREVIDEQILDTVANPTDPVTLTVNTGNLEPGVHDAELRVSVFDQALNEDSIFRNVSLLTCPPDPWACISDSSFSNSIWIGDTIPTVDTFTVVNCGCSPQDLNYGITVEYLTASQGWLQVTPDSGTSSGEPGNPHDIVYDVSGLPAGEHQARVVVNGDYNQAAILVTVNVDTSPADYSGDGDVDQDDYAHLQACLTGNGGTVTDPNCMDCDLDSDEDCDTADVVKFSGCMTGAGILVMPDNCQ